MTIKFVPMKRQSYPHGDLSRALVREAVHTIQKDGVDALTLRAVGQKLGTTGLNIATRVLGLLLAAIAIETMADGLKVLFPGLTSA